MKNNRLVIGVDYGTDSCRVIVLSVETGQELASSIKYYPRWKAGLYCDPANNQYRQHPLDYIETLEDAIKEALSNCPFGSGEQVLGIAFDTTGSTPVLLDREGTPLALLPEYSENPNAMFILWKDHTAVCEAAEINALAYQWSVDYTSFSGGAYSAEWVWAKMLYALRTDYSLHKIAYSWVEHCDWMPALLTGNTKPESIVRSRCAAGHKAMWHESWEGLPSEAFLETIDPLFSVFKGHLFSDTYTSDTVVGNLTENWAERLGLTTNVVVAVGGLDCHMGAVGAGIKEGSFVSVMGTSTCDIMVVAPDILKGRSIKGICGQVDGSVIPGYIGLEAGQSAFGDIYAWFKNILLWPTANFIGKNRILSEEQKQELVTEIDNIIIAELTVQAEQLSDECSTITSLDWFNGRRTPNANSLVKGVISGLTLGTTAPMIFKSLVEATAFGSKSIVNCFLQQGIGINEVIAIGGISQKSPFVMQTLSDVLGMPIKVSGAEQACALGAAVFAAVSAGVYSSTEDAILVMGKGFISEYVPDTIKKHMYADLYEKYLLLGLFSENNTDNLIGAMI